MNDALNHPIQLGHLYGYTTSKSGWSMVVIGEATKIKESKVSLQVKARRNFLYNKPTDYSRNKSKTVTIHSHHLFPVNAEGWSL